MEEVYALLMKRLQVLFEQATSKAVMIWRRVRERLQPQSPPEDDPLWQMAGVDDYEPEAVDEVTISQRQGP